MKCSVMITIFMTPLKCVENLRGPLEHVKTFGIPLLHGNAIISMHIFEVE